MARKQSAIRGLPGKITRRPESRGVPKGVRSERNRHASPSSSGGYRKCHMQSVTCGGDGARSHRRADSASPNGWGGPETKADETSARRPARARACCQEGHAAASGRRRQASSRGGSGQSLVKTDEAPRVHTWRLVPAGRKGDPREMAHIRNSAGRARAGKSSILEPGVLAGERLPRGKARGGDEAC